MAKPRIFICYRRDDSSDDAQRLHDRLCQHFDDDDVFIDNKVRPGSVITPYLVDLVASCDVLLAVIGPEWLTQTAAGGAPRLLNEHDYVRVEIATALRTGVTVVPVRVKNASMPHEQDLPADIAALAERGDLELLDRGHWEYSVLGLITAIQSILDEADAKAVAEGAADTAPAPRAPAQAGSIAATEPRVDEALEGPRRPPLSRRTVIAMLLGFATLGAVAILVFACGGRSLRIYSSLPERGPGAARSAGMENAMRLALEQADHKAGTFDVAYTALDDSDATGDSPAAIVEGNARRAERDGDTAAYIGDFSSDATQYSIPVLSRGRVPQISVSSTRVGLTVDDPLLGDTNEPGRYYPDGYRNFVRIIPNVAVHARALVALMVRDGCRQPAMIDDNSSYGQDLANHILEENGRVATQRMHFVFSQLVGPYGRDHQLLRRAQAKQADCFVYSGTVHRNTVNIFTKFAAELQPRRLYGSNGVVAASFYAQLPESVARKVTLMVPPYDAEGFARFASDYARRFPREPAPDPYAAYAYEAMRLALTAIDRSRTGDRNDIRDALFDTTPLSGSTLHPYSITDDGDTSFDRYGYAGIDNGKLGPVRLVRFIPRLPAAP